MPDSPEKLVNEIKACRICVERPLKSVLPHEPRPVVRLSSSARICIAGQAPGLRVHKSGLPFDDPSGDRLREWMGIGKDVFYDESRIAMVPMGFCFPGYDKNNSDLPPRKECVAHWHDRIFTTMPQLELVLVIGQYAQAYHLGKQRKKSVTDTVASWREYFQPDEGASVLALPHPSWRNTAWLKRHPWFEDDVLPVLRAEIQHLI